LPDDAPWTREAFQRNAIMIALRDAACDDVVLLLDADEIVSRPTLECLRRDGLDRPRRLALTRHYEYVDQVAPGSACCPPRDAPFPFNFAHPRPGYWNQLEPLWSERTAAVVRYSDLTGDEDRVRPPRSASEIRRLMDSAPTIRDAGRHLSSTDPSSRFERKLLRVPHEELSGGRARNAMHLARTRRAGVHHHGWWYAETPSGALPDDIARLAQASPATRRSEPLPPPVMRVLVRSWAWLRFWNMWSDRFVASIDAHFEMLLPLVAVPLLAADLLRRAAGFFDWPWLGRMSAAGTRHGHGA
jgi:beta-1,4-mannosyl-glycoprotein beta-1,4-N-acetylglucosaminyltransferase